MDKLNTNNLSSHKVKLSPLKLNNMSNKYNSSESRKEDINIESTPKSYMNSMRYVPTFDDSTFESKKLHIIKKPYKIFLPIRTKMNKIKNNRKLSLNNYYKKALKIDLFQRDIMTTESIISKITNSQETFKNIRIKNKSNLKTPLDNSKSNQNNNISKNVGFLSTERTLASKDITNFNISNISKKNDYDKYNIFSYTNKKRVNTNNNIINNINKNINNNYFTNSKNIIFGDFKDYPPLRFANINQGYTNLPNVKHCVNNFTNGIKNLTIEKYMNYCLKEKETTTKEYKESNDSNFKLEMKKKIDNKNLFEAFYKDYNTYCHKLKEKEEKDGHKINLLNWEIISFKNEVNRLNIKKDKLLTRLNKYIKMKEFLITMRNYSLDKKDDDLIFDKSSTNNILIKERRIKNNNTKKFARRQSQQIESIGKLNEIKIKGNKSNEKFRKNKRTNSARDKNPLLSSAVKEISTILNNHISNLLIYQNQLRMDLEPLKQQFNNLYKDLKESDEKKNKLLKLQFLIFPEKKRIAKERNEFLTKTLFNIKNNIYNSTNYNKMNNVLLDRLIFLYNILIDNKIISFSRIKASLEDNIVEKIFFYLKNIENGLNILFENKKKLKENYPKAYNDLIKEINDLIKLRALEAQKKKDVNQGNKKMHQIANKCNKSLILDRRKDYYQFGFKKLKKKKKTKKIDPYEELRYSDDNENEEEEK